MKQINAKVISKFNPCKDRFDNFKNKYPNFSGDYIEFLSLNEISYSDKTWVIARLMSKEQKIRWAVACAWSVIEIFESKYPENKAPRKVLEFLDNIEHVDKLTEEQLSELRKLRVTAAAAAYAAAAAADAAAADAAAYAAAAAAYAAAAAAAADAAARQHQQDLNLLLAQVVIEEHGGL